MRAHIGIGLAVIAVLWYLNNLYKWRVVPTDNLFYLQIIGITILYSILPDWDQPGSKINEYMTLLLGGVILFTLLGYLQMWAGIYAVGLIIFFRVIDHRTIVHSVLFGLIVSLPLYYFFGPIHFAIGLVAYTSHIVADNDFSWGWEPDADLRLFRRKIK